MSISSAVALTSSSVSKYTFLRWRPWPRIVRFVRATVVDALPTSNSSSLKPVPTKPPGNTMVSRSDVNCVDVTVAVSVRPMTWGP